MEKVSFAVYVFLLFIHSFNGSGRAHPGFLLSLSPADTFFAPFQLSYFITKANKFLTLFTHLRRHRGLRKFLWNFYARSSSQVQRQHLTSTVKLSLPRFTLEKEFLLTIETFSVVLSSSLKQHCQHRTRKRDAANHNIKSFPQG